MPKAKVECTQPDCLKTFTRNSDLKRHMSTCHEGLRKFECDECTHAFQQASHLKTHKLTHSKTLVYCPNFPCNFSCTDPSSLSRHKRKSCKHWGALAQAPPVAIEPHAAVEPHAATAPPAPIAPLAPIVPAAYRLENINVGSWDQNLEALQYYYEPLVPSKEDVGPSLYNDFSWDISSGSESSGSTSSASSSAAPAPSVPSEIDFFPDLPDINRFLDFSGCLDPKLFEDYE